MTFAAQPHYYLYIYNKSCLRAQRVCEAHSRNPDQNTSKHQIFPSSEPDLKPRVAAAVGCRYKGFHSNQLALFSSSSQSLLVIQYESVISWRVSSELRRFLFVLWMQWEDSTTSVSPLMLVSVIILSRFRFVSMFPLWAPLRKTWVLLSWSEHT